MDNAIEVKSFTQAQYWLLHDATLYAELDNAKMFVTRLNNKIEVQIQPKFGSTRILNNDFEAFEQIFNETSPKITYYAIKDIEIQYRKNNIFDIISDKIRKIKNES